MFSSKNPTLCILSQSSQQSRSLESIIVRLWFRPLCQIGRWMFAHCTGIERGLVYLSERAGESLMRLVGFTRVTYHPLSGVNIPVGGFIMVKEEAQMLRFSLVAVSLPTNWKETNSFSPIRWRYRRPDEDASSSIDSNVSNSTTFRQKLDFRTITILVYACDKFSFRQILFYIFDLFSRVREPVVDYLLLFVEMCRRNRYFQQLSTDYRSA